MPNLHDIERRISSVKSTKQITRTMEMVAAAKIRRASDRMTNALPWANAVSDALVSTARHISLDNEPLLKKHAEIRRTLIVVLTSDRGLAGGFNSNVLRETERIMKHKEAQGIECEIIACGKKGIAYLKYRGIEPVLEFRDVSADPSYEEATQIAQYASSSFIEGRIDEVLIVFNHAKNAAEQRLVVEPVLPIEERRFADILGIKPQEKDIFKDFVERERPPLEGDVAFEPDASSAMQYLLDAYIRGMFYFALIDSAAGEQGARRTAMKAATDNASDMITTLTRLYNQVRQGAITTEISEIVGGAAALEDN